MARRVCTPEELKRKLSRLKGFVYSYVDRAFPGYIQSMDSVAWLRYSKTTLDLLVEKPSELYRLLLDHYGDEDSADYAMSMVYLYPVSLFLKDIELQHRLLECAKKGKDEEFLKVIADALCGE